MTSSGTLAISALPTLDLDDSRFDDHRKYIKNPEIASNLEKLYQLVDRLTSYSKDWSPTIHLIDNQDFFYVCMHKISHNPSLFEVAKGIGYETHADSVIFTPDANLWCFYFKSVNYTIPYVGKPTLDNLTKKEYRDVVLVKTIAPSLPQFDILDELQDSVARQLLFEIIIILNIRMDKVSIISKHVTHGKSVTRKSDTSPSNQTDKLDNELVESEFVIEILSCDDSVSVYDTFSHFKKFSHKGFMIENIRYEDKPKSLTFSLYGEVKKRSLSARPDGITCYEDIDDDILMMDEDPENKKKKKKLE
jgi:hypothetical protein